jgi:hypothetical protein
VRVPILETVCPPEFGELKEDPRFHDVSGMDRDFTFVPGFSELRRARDLAIAEVRAGKRRANEVPTLPVNMRWSRCQNKRGDVDNRKVIRAGNRGYKAVTEADVGEGKLLPTLPAGAFKAADGTIRQGDCQLMVADAAKVARNEFQKRVRTESMTKGAVEGFEAACRAAGLKTSGTSPEITVETGKRVQAVLEPKTAKK